MQFDYSGIKKFQKFGYKNWEIEKKISEYVLLKLKVIKINDPTYLHRKSLSQNFFLLLKMVFCRRFRRSIRKFHRLCFDQRPSDSVKIPLCSSILRSLCCPREQLVNF